MTDRQTQHARVRAVEEPEEAGFDVWLPALAAIAAAFFLILSASAQDAAPRAIYSADRFAMSEAERTMLEEQAAHAADVLARSAERFRAAHERVEMRALPELRVAVAEARSAAIAATPVRIATRPVIIADPTSSEPSPGWLRLAMALAIAAMLGGALYLLDRTWRRTGPMMPDEQAAA